MPDVYSDHATRNNIKETLFQTNYVFCLPCCQVRTEGYTLALAGHRTGEVSPCTRSTRDRSHVPSRRWETCCPHRLTLQRKNIAGWSCRGLGTFRWISHSPQAVTFCSVSRKLFSNSVTKSHRTENADTWINRCSLWKLSSKSLKFSSRAQGRLFTMLIIQLLHMFRLDKRRAVKPFDVVLITAFLY